MAKVNPKSNSPARSLIQMSEWDPTRIQGFEGEQGNLGRWDVAAPADRIDGDGLGSLTSLPAVSNNTIGARSPAMPGSSGDPSEPTVLSERVTWNTPSSSDGRANLASDGGIRSGMTLLGTVTWNTPDVSYIPPPISKRGNRS